MAGYTAMTSAPKDAPVEPDFAAMIQQTWARYQNEGSQPPWNEFLVRAAFAAGRQAAPQPEGGISDRNSDGTPIDWKATWAAENWLREQDQARIAALEAALPDDIRAAGWVLAIHNDYRQNGEAHTFWLFTSSLLDGGRWAKGEGRTDAEALNQVRYVIGLRAALTPTSGAADGKGEEG